MVLNISTLYSFSMVYNTHLLGCIQHSYLHLYFCSGWIGKFLPAVAKQSDSNSSFKYVLKKEYPRGPK